MQVLINDDELVEALARRMIFQYCRDMRPDFSNVDRYLQKCLKQLQKKGTCDFALDDVKNIIVRDLLAWRDHLNAISKKFYRPLVNWLKDNIDRLELDRQALVYYTKKVRHTTFTQQVASALIDRYSIIVDRKNINPDLVLIRNIINNETVLQQRMKQQQDFWFIDSGYTNFLHGSKKQWHRLVPNHIHPAIDNRYFPADRLPLLPVMPNPWRSEGRDILVIESSERHHCVFGTDSETWKQQLTEELRAHTGRNIEFRPKILSRKIRQSVYEMLQQDPDRWYCVISHSSAAAIEAIWLGIPAITLGQHITNPVSRSQIEHINDLYRGPIGNWLCALTYSQFTKQELITGQAIKLIRQFHHV